MSSPNVAILSIILMNMRSCCHLLSVVLIGTKRITISEDSASISLLIEMFRDIGRVTIDPCVVSPCSLLSKHEAQGRGGG